jgi:prepilin-type N-terminal cleavage/methylation domain-containing protein
MSSLTRRLAAPDHEADRGFGMVEMMVSLVIIAIVTTAALSFFLNGLSSEAGQRQRQEAIYLADQQMQTVQAVPAADLVQGRTSAAQTAALSTPVATTLNLAAQTDSTSGAGFDSNAADTTLIPLSQTQTVNKVNYTLWTFVYACHLQVSSNTLCGPNAATGSTTELRATVAVTWTSHANCTQGCNYSTSTLVDPSSDQLFNTNISIPTGAITTPTPALPTPAAFFNTNTGTRGIGVPPPPYESCTTGPVGNTVTMAGTKMIITGANLKSNIRVLISSAGGSIPTNSIYQPSATEVDACLQTSDTPGTYTISVVNNDGGHFQTSVVERPVIRWVALTGSGANQTLTLNGGGFVTGATLAATGGVNGNFTVVSKTQATLTQYVAPTPGLAAAPVLTLTDPSPGLQQATFTLPDMSATTTPSAVAVGKVVTVNVTGTGFQPGLATTLVTNATVTVTSSTATSASLTILASPVGTMSFALLNPDGGVSNPISLTVDPLPTVVAPGSHVLGSTWTINGTGFLPGMTASITGGDAVVVNSQTGTTAASLTVIGSTSGSLFLTLTNFDGGTVGPTPITILPLPKVTSSSPTFGVSGQVAVTLTGTNFQSTMTVTDANGTVTNITRSGTTGITMMLTGAAGPHTLTLTNPDGGVTTWVVTVDAPLIITAATMTAIEGVPVAVAGSGFTASTSTTTPGATVSFVSATQVNVTFANTGSQTLTLSNTDGGTDNVVATVSGPVITSLTQTAPAPPTKPTHGAGKTVSYTVNGTGFVTGGTFSVSWTKGGTTTNPVPTAQNIATAFQGTLTVATPASASGTWTLTVTIQNPDGGTDSFAQSVSVQ